jgi:hypothetical protein
MNEADRSTCVNVVVGHSAVGVPIRKQLSLATLAASLARVEFRGDAPRNAPPAAAAQTGGEEDTEEEPARTTEATQHRQRLEAIALISRQDRRRKKSEATTINGKLENLRQRRAAKATQRSTQRFTRRFWSPNAPHHALAALP